MQTFVGAVCERLSVTTAPGATQTVHTEGLSRRVAGLITVQPVLPV